MDVCQRCLGWLPDGAYACIVLSSTASGNEETFILSGALHRISKGDRISLLVVFLLPNNKSLLYSKCAYLQLKKGLSAFTGIAPVRLLLWS